MDGGGRVNTLMFGSYQIVLFNSLLFNVNLISVLTYKEFDLTQSTLIALHREPFVHPLVQRELCRRGGRGTASGHRGRRGQTRSDWTPTGGF